MNPSAVKIIGNTYTLFDRGLRNLASATELGILVPMVDPKFITAYAINNALESPTNSAAVTVKNDIGNVLSQKTLLNFDDKGITNAMVGPSSSGVYKGSIEYRPVNKEAAFTLNCSPDILGDPDSLKIALEDGDRVIYARQPKGIVETSTKPTGDLVIQDQINTKWTPRIPRIMNVHDHAFTLISNFDSGESEYFVFPVTGAGSINPDSIYRFSFYYRLNGTFLFKPIIEYFTDTGPWITTHDWPIQNISGTATEDTDYDYFDILIPQMNGLDIPSNTGQIRISLFFAATEDSKIEIGYPILEHVFNSGLTPYVFLPEPPSSIGYKDIHSERLTASDVGTNISFDASKLFSNHLGRKMFQTTMSFSLLDSNYLDQLYVLENFNIRGSLIVFRPKHHDLPPVMTGNISVTQANPTYDYHQNDTVLRFVETQ